MEIKYSGYNPTQTFIVSKYNFRKMLKRNIWCDVPNEVGKILMKNHHFLSKDDILFDKTNFNTLNKTIGLLRNSALGDIIQLIPIVHYLKRTTNNKYVLITQKHLIESVKPLNVFDDVIARKTGDVYKIINLDGVLERDHSLTDIHREMHRIKLYEEYLEIELDKYDFTVYIS